MASVNISVEVDGNIEKALKRFKKKMLQAQVMEDYRDHLVFVKPSVKKRKKRLDAIYNYKKNNNDKQD